MLFSAVRRQLMARIMKIGTHNGCFHADETLACWMLKQLPEFRDAEIVRTRDPALLSKCDMVVDVGGVFDPSTRRFDHHQREFVDTMDSLAVLPGFVTKLSSAGLVYAHYGRQLLRECGGPAISGDDGALETLFEKLYRSFMEEIDAVDNGIPPHDGPPRYAGGSSLPSRVSHLNPAWNKTEMDENVQFHVAMEMAGGELLDRIRYFVDSWLPARGIVESAVKNRFQVDESGAIMALEKGGVPWKEHFFILEKHFEPEHQGQIKYIVYADQNGSFRVQAVPVSETEGFANRLGLPDAWRGLRDAQLEEASGISGTTFVHAGGFIGGNKTREGALSMARKSLEMQQKK